MMNKISLADIEMKKKQRRLATQSAIRRDYEKNEKQKFNLATEARPGSNQLPRLKQEQELKVSNSLRFNDFRPKPLPDFNRKQADVKLNVAALKREKALIDKEEQEKNLQLN